MSLQPPAIEKSNLVRGKVITYAIGGRENERKMRCAVASRHFPEFDNFYHQIVGFFPIPPTTQPELLQSEWSSAKTQRAVVNANDTLLMIGHTSVIPAQAMAMFEAVHPDAKIYVQGPGFNLLPPRIIGDFKSKYKNIMFIPHSPATITL